MGLAETDEAAGAAMLRRLGRVVAVHRPAEPSERRDDLRLFAITWTGGFLFFLAFLG